MKLDDIHKENIFKVPDGYFDTLPGRIQDRILEAGPEIASVRPIFYRRYLAPIAAAAMVVLLAVLVITEKKPTPEELIARVPTESLISYLVSSDISTEEIFENINPSIIAEDFFTEDDMSIDSLDISGEDVEQMLNELGANGEYL
jgi:hypothetical protein